MIALVYCSSMPTAPHPPHGEVSDQNDVVLLLRIQRLDLQRDRLADEVAELRQALRFFVEEKIDHRLRGEDAEFAGAELLGLAHDLSQNLVADRLRGLDLAAAGAGRARLAQNVSEALSRALARHLDQAELGESVDREPSAVARQCLAEFSQHRGPMVDILHVDE